LTNRKGGGIREIIQRRWLKRDKRSLLTDREVIIHRKLKVKRFYLKSAKSQFYLRKEGIKDEKK